MFKFNEVFNKRPDYSGKKINKNNSSTIGDIFNLIFGSKKVNLELPKIEKSKDIEKNKINSSPVTTKKVKKESKEKTNEATLSKRTKRSRKLSNSSVSKLTTADKDTVNEINAMFQEFIRNSKKEVKKPYYPHETYLDDDIESEGVRRGL